MRLPLSHTLLVVLLVASALVPAGALAGSGGTGLPPPPTPRGGQAKLVGGLAIAPRRAPQRVVSAVDAANHIAKGHPYCLGGGHRDWKSNCYDCSGAVSYALHAAGLLDHPLDSTGLESWGRAGADPWVTVYANQGHAFMVIAGLRFDTADTLGGGPGWAADMGGYENPKKFKIRGPA